VDLFLIPPLKGGFNPIPSLALPLKGREIVIVDSPSTTAV
jgi:hypothetical protein